MIIVKVWTCWEKAWRNCEKVHNGFSYNEKKNMLKIAQKLKKITFLTYGSKRRFKIWHIPIKSIILNKSLKSQREA
jgi:hypothetical protein